MNGENQGLEHVINDLRKEIDKKKQAIKSNMFLSEDFFDTFELFLSNGINYYLENCDKPYSSENKHRLISTVINSVLEQSAICAEEYRQYQNQQK